MKVTISIDYIRLKTNLKNIQVLIFTKKSFFCTSLNFTKSYSRVLGDLGGFVQLIPGSYKTDKPIKTPGVDKFHLKCDCIIGPIINGIRAHILYV